MSDIDTLASKAEELLRLIKGGLSETVREQQDLQDENEGLRTELMTAEKDLDLCRNEEDDLQRILKTIVCGGDLFLEDEMFLRSFCGEDAVGVLRERRARERG